MRYSYHASPVGDLLIAGRGEAVHHISFPSGDRATRPKRDWHLDDGVLGDLRRQLDEYFAGERTTFELDLRIDGKPFEIAVWRALMEIPYGQTVSYGEIALQIGEPLSASRAVGAANGANPLPIVIPCHRVIGADGSLTGFGGGLATKQFLLDLEDRVQPRKGAQLRLFA